MNDFLGLSKRHVVYVCNMIDKNDSVAHIAAAAENLAIDTLDARRVAIQDILAKKLDRSPFVILIAHAESVNDGDLDALADCNICYEDSHISRQKVVNAVEKCGRDLDGTPHVVCGLICSSADFSGCSGNWIGCDFGKNYGLAFDRMLQMLQKELHPGKESVPLKFEGEDGAFVKDKFLFGKGSDSYHVHEFSKDVFNLKVAGKGNRLRYGSSQDGAKGLEELLGKRSAEDGQATIEEMVQYVIEKTGADHAYVPADKGKAYLRLYGHISFRMHLNDLCYIVSQNPVSGQKALKILKEHQWIQKETRAAMENQICKMCNI